MAREFKFRAWDAERKALVLGNEIEEFTEELDEISYKVDCSRYTTGLSYGKLFVAYTNKRGDWEECPLMQFTGLTDCEGTPVYEGDVVSDEGGTTSVYWSDAMGAWAVQDSDDCAFLLADCHNTLTVIGNIYQHPHLLEAK